MKLKILYVAIIFVTIPVSAARPMTALFAEHLNVSLVSIGIITSCYSVSPLILAFFAGKLIDNYGEKSPLIYGSLGIIISLILPFIFPNFFVLFFSQILLGASQLLTILAVQSGVANGENTVSREKAVGTFSFYNSIGMFIGPIIGGYASESFGFQNAYLIISWFPIVTIIISCFLKVSHNTTKNNSIKYALPPKELFKIPGMRNAICISMAILSAVDIFQIYFPLYAKSQGISLSSIGWLLSLQAFSSIIIRILMHKLLLCFTKSKLLMVCLFVGGIGNFAIPFISEFHIIFLITLVIGAGLGITQPLTIIITSALAPDGQTGTVLGIRMAANRLAQTIIPLISAIFSTYIGFGFVFFVNFFLLTSGAISASKLLEKNKKSLHKKNKKPR